MHLYKYSSCCTKIEPNNKDSKSSLDNLLASFNESYFWASPIKSLNDPYEGIYDDLPVYNLLEHFVNENNAEMYPVLIDSIKEIKNISEKQGVFSLTDSYENKLMWIHYANNFDGICIEYDTQYLKTFNRNLELIQVKYEANPIKNNKFTLEKLSASKDLIQIVLGIKDEMWEYENEYRVISQCFGENFLDIRSIKTIYFGFNVNREKIKTVMYSLKGRKVNYKIVSPKKDDINLDIRSIDDLYLNEKRYYKKALIPDWIKEYSKSSDNELDLYRAAELVSTFPHVAEIINIIEKDANLISVNIKTNSIYLPYAKVFINKSEL